MSFGWLITLASAALKIWSALSGWLKRRQGAEQQQAKDMGEVLDVVKQKERAEAQAARSSDDALREQLYRDGPRPNR